MRIAGALTRPALNPFGKHEDKKHGCVTNVGFFC